MFEINNRFVDLRIVEAKLVRDLALNLTKDIELLLPCYGNLMENDIIACISFYVNKNNSIISELEFYMCDIPGLEIHLKGSNEEVSLVEIVITKSTLPESKYDFVSNLLLTIIKFYNGTLKIAEFKESGQDSESLMDKFVGTEKPKRYDNFAGIEFPTETTHAILDSEELDPIEQKVMFTFDSNFLPLGHVYASRLNHFMTILRPLEFGHSYNHMIGQCVRNNNSGTIHFICNADKETITQLGLYFIDCTFITLQVLDKNDDSNIAIVKLMSTDTKIIPEEQYRYVSNVILAITEFYNGNIREAEFKGDIGTEALIGLVRSAILAMETNETKAYKPTEPQFTILDSEELHPLDQHEVIQLEYLQSSLDLLKRLHLEDKDKEKGYSDGQIALYDATLNNMKHVIKSLLGK